MTSLSDRLLDVSGLSKSYLEGASERLVLSDVSFSVRRGELVVLLGRSGSGKSTLLNLISGMDVPTSGSVRFGDTDLTRMSDTDRTLFRRHALGIIFQSFNLIPTLTVRENILLPLELAGKKNGRTDEQALAVLQDVGLADRADTFPDRLSGGEQQRVAIARALAHDPLLVLADEPTGNLDFRTAATVMDILESLVHNRSRTMLIATHDRDIISLADRVFSLQGGLLTEVSAAEAAQDR
ncbi:MAG: ABC transporter ATP-binding protein [Bacteroidetes bacterium]|nr:ABC transporter ATP-binding protein [Bacteroidota bacterium]MDA0874723.1 ABC transporter ATP-binding protein [Bacteroidota bacterium]